MANKVGELYWEVDANTSKFDKSLKTTETKGTSLGKKFTSVGKLIAAGLGVVAVAAIAKVGAAVARVAIDLVNVASDAQETSQKFSVTFSEISEAANEAADNLSESFGLSSQAAESLLADTGDLLTGFGFTQKASLDLSNQVNELAVDLASFTNFAGGAEGASAALTKGLLGEREAMKSLGISIMEADIKQLAEDKGIVGELDRQTKAMLTLELAVTQSKNAIGDFQRSSDSYANQLRVAKAATEDLKAALGEALLPAATNVVTKVGELNGVLATMIERSNEVNAANRVVETGIGDVVKAYDVQAQRVEGLQALYDAAQFTVKDSLLTELRLEEKKLFALDKLRTQQKIANDEAEAAAADLASRAAEEEAIVKAKEDAEKGKLKAAQDYATFIQDEYSSTEEGKVAQLQEEIALIQEGILLYGDSTEAQTVLIEKQQELKEALGETGDGLKDNKDLWDEWADNAEARIDELSSIGINSLLSSFSDLGEAFVAGELGWDSFATAGLNAIAAVLQALGAQLAAQAALLFAQSFSTLGATLALAAPALAGSAAAYASAGVVSGLAGSFESGGLQPGIPSTTDDRLSSVASGEEVLRADDSRNIANSGESSAGGDVYLDAYKVGYYLAENVYNTGQVLLDGKRAIRK